MMETADLYVRVSTDEQADKGYSQRNQEEVLVRYCNNHGIAVNRVVYEDFSAKTFFRPEWSRLLGQLKEKGNKSNLVLFTKWDRFSRNAGDAYMMINTLKKLGVEPQAIEQPLDLSIPENKMMLAFYLAAPEVENDRGSLNIFHGMRRGLKEGRWLWMAPYGYGNARDNFKRPVIEIEEEEAAHVKWIFENLAAANYSSEQVLLHARRRGAKLHKNKFWRIVRNPFYCGKLYVPEFNEEKGHFVRAQHKPLISEELFYRVQDALQVKKRKRRTEIVSPEVIPLRGFLKCPKCSRNLTASASKGRNQYCYYHCTSKCGVRFNAKDVNTSFRKFLSKFKPKKGMLELFEMVFNQAFLGENKIDLSEKRKLKSAIEKLEQKISISRDLFIDEKLDIEDYRSIKRSCEEEIERLEAKGTKIGIIIMQDIPEKVKKALEMTERLELFFDTADLSIKRKIIGSIFPENIVFDGKQHRTARVKELFQDIYQINSMITYNKISPKSKKSTLDRVVDPLGLEPRLF
ncbi:recombinase family protein [Echinicola rosea]|uniref:recombinase family protein n=2 Tax=Echinicola rosea TaxID=1807691 RepID=UPI001FD05BA5|nr:recombinase family protein [Echinicola rosea]